MKNLIKRWLGISEIEKSVAIILLILLENLKNKLDCIITENGFTKEYEDELLKDSKLKKKKYSSFAEAHKKFNKVTKKHVRKSK